MGIIRSLNRPCGGIGIHSRLRACALTGMLVRVQSGALRIRAVLATAKKVDGVGMVLLSFLPFFLFRFDKQFVKTLAI